MAECPDLTTVQPWRRLVASLLSLLYLGLISWVPLILLGHGVTTLPFGVLEIAFAPLCFVLVAGLLSLPHQRHVVEGRMKVDLAIPAYFHRRLYGLCWTAVYYSGPVYALVLGIPLLKKFVFRLFGYRGQMDFTLYPDTWIRDLPLLDLGEGCYLSNKSTVGTNMIFYRRGVKWIEVGRIRIGARSMVGHLSALGPSCVVGDDVQIGVMTGIGRRVTIGDMATVGDAIAVDHGAQIEAGASLPSASYLGMGRTLGELEVHLPGSVLRRERPLKPALHDFAAQEK